MIPRVFGFLSSSGLRLQGFLRAWRSASTVSGSRVSWPRNISSCRSSEAPRMHSLISTTQSRVGIAPCRTQKQQKQDSSRESVHVCAATGPWQGDLQAFKRLMVLPGGAWFMSDADADAPVYGDSFVMQRHAAGQQAGSQTGGLVRLRARPPVAVQRRPQQSADIIPLRLEEVEVSIVVLGGDDASSSSSIVPFRRLLAAPGDSSSSSSTSLAIVPRGSSAMLGVVMSSAVRRRDDAVPLPSDEAVYETPFNDKNPRRTMKIKFKCKRCGATTIKPVNPHAWATGTVFAKCGCCQVTHKLIDNLKLFHELAGPVFGPGTQAPKPPRRERLGLRLESDSTTLPQLPPRLRLRLPLDGFPDDTAGLN